MHPTHAATAHSAILRSNPGLRLTKASRTPIFAMTISPVHLIFGFKVLRARLRMNTSLNRWNIEKSKVRSPYCTATKVVLIGMSGWFVRTVEGRGNVPPTGGDKADIETLRAEGSPEAEKYKVSRPNTLPICITGVSITSNHTVGDTHGNYGECHISSSCGWVETGWKGLASPSMNSDFMSPTFFVSVATM